MKEGFVPLTKKNQSYRANLVNKHGREAWIDTMNWADRGCWIYFKNVRHHNNSMLLEYKDFKDWFIDERI